MSLDAWVWCDCIQTGQLTKPHPYPELLYIDEGDWPFVRSDDEVKAIDHLLWMASDACPHPGRMLLHYFMGNSALVAFMRDMVGQFADDPPTAYPVLWQQVIYSGSHCGDWLEVPAVRQLEAELARLREQDLSGVEAKDAEYFRRFLHKLKHLSQVSLATQRPIVF
ncbi:MAG: hypothetical protein JOZ57_17755 [Abitibacteriaceae bacterium]|nr:hypothetical protein [Abditibacteriaceae bacterium]